MGLFDWLIDPYGIKRQRRKDARQLYLHQQLSRQLMQHPQVQQQMAQCHMKQSRRDSFCRHAVLSSRSIDDFYTQNTPQGKCLFIEDYEDTGYYRNLIAKQGFAGFQQQVLRNPPWIEECHPMKFVPTSMQRHPMYREYHKLSGGMI